MNEGKASSRPEHSPTSAEAVRQQGQDLLRRLLTVKGSCTQEEIDAYFDFLVGDGDDDRAVAVQNISRELRGLYMSSLSVSQSSAGWDRFETPQYTGPDQAIMGLVFGRSPAKDDHPMKLTKACAAIAPQEGGNLDITDKYERYFWEGITILASRKGVV